MKPLAAIIVTALMIPAAAAAEADRTALLYHDAANEWARWLGEADACTGRNREDDLRTEAERSAAILHPGLIAWATGRQDKAVSSLTTRWQLLYLAAKLSPNCLGAAMLEANYRKLLSDILKTPE